MRKFLQPHRAILSLSADVQVSLGGECVQSNIHLVLRTSLLLLELISLMFLDTGVSEVLFKSD